MFEIGDKIVYGAEGVFAVSELAGSPTDKKDTRLFYILKPVFGKDTNIIYTPVEGGIIRMRPVISREEAIRLIDRLGEITEVVVEREKNRREVYRTVMKDGCAAEYVSIIKTVMARRTVFFKQKKRLPEADVEYEKRAKLCLYGELSVAMNMPYDRAEAMISERLAANT